MSCIWKAVPTNPYSHDITTSNTLLYYITHDPLQTASQLDRRTVARETNCVVTIGCGKATTGCHLNVFHGLLTESVLL